MLIKSLVIIKVINMGGICCKKKQMLFEDRFTDEEISESDTLTNISDSYINVSLHGKKIDSESEEMIISDNTLNDDYIYEYVFESDINNIDNISDNISSISLSSSKFISDKVKVLIVSLPCRRYKNFEDRNNYKIKKNIIYDFLIDNTNILESDIEVILDTGGRQVINIIEEFILNNNDSKLLIAYIGDNTRSTDNIKVNQLINKHDILYNNIISDFMLKKLFDRIEINTKLYFIIDSGSCGMMPTLPFYQYKKGIFENEIDNRYKVNYDITVISCSNIITTTTGGKSLQLCGGRDFSFLNTVVSLLIKYKGSKSWSKMLSKNKDSYKNITLSVNKQRLLDEKIDLLFG